MYCLVISLATTYATTVFRTMKKARIKEGTWPWPEDITFQEWVQQEMGPEAVELIPKQIPETLPPDTGKYTVEPIELTDPKKRGQE